VLLSGAVLRPALLAGGAAAAAMAAALTAAIGGRSPALVSTIAVAVWATVGAAFAAGGRLTAAEAAGLTLALLLPLSGQIPVLSFRLAGLHLDPLPTTPDELQIDLDPIPGQELMERTRWADRYQNALSVGLAVVAVGCFVPLGLARGWPAHLVTLDVAAAMLLHGRVLVGVRQRLAAVLPPVVGLAVLSVFAGVDTSGSGWLGLFAALVLVGGGLFAAGQALPGRKTVPHWGWAGDMLQSLAALALLPLVLWLLDLYQYARAVHL
jgi:type VII secretion integral membrane protein EccD